MARLDTAVVAPYAMKIKELLKLGFSHGDMVEAARRAAQAAAAAGMDKRALRDTLCAVIDAPETFAEHPLFGELAQRLLAKGGAHGNVRPRETPAPHARWGDDIDAEAAQQMEHACRLPVSVAGALMPDAHIGYGLPIGGVLAVRGAVIPYAVGVDIACRVKLSVLDLPVSALETQNERLIRALERETRFGVGVTFQKRREHAVMDADWNVTKLTAQLKDKAWAQLGTSGSGNHFVEYGILTVYSAEAGLAPGAYLALLSHSGSRGAGAAVAAHYSKLAMARHPQLPRELIHLAWLDLDSHEGQEYWRAMNLMGAYAAANHDCIHRHVVNELGAHVLFAVENHHNFAWVEEHFVERLIVHRKGATPAGAGVLGFIPGSMADPGYLVRGLGNPASLHSAAHGAGRRMSRSQARRELTWPTTKKLLAERGVTLLSAGLDESPLAYKNIDEVMAAQADLVRPLARFDPKLVKMAPPGERPED